MRDSDNRPIVKSKLSGVIENTPCRVELLYLELLWGDFPLLIQPLSHTATPFAVSSMRAESLGDRATELCRHVCQYQAGGLRRGFAGIYRAPVGMLT